MALVLVADAAYPFDYALLPGNVDAVAGYVGGDTPHVWSAAEIAAVRATGRWFWAIWTAPSRGQAITAAQGGIDGAGTVSALAARGYPKTDPVFYDVEYADWTADPAGARAGITAFKNTLTAAGYPHTFAYVPYSAGFDWVAYWDNIAPSVLPAGWVGQQYGGNAVSGHADLSIFDTERLGMDVTISQASLQAIGAQVTQHIGLTVANLQQDHNELAVILGDVQGLQRDLANVLADVVALANKIGAGGGQPLDLAAITAAAKAGADAAIATMTLTVGHAGG